MKIKPSAFFLLFVGISALSAFVIGGFALHKNAAIIPAEKNSPRVTAEPASWVPYTSETVGFSLQHPLGVTVTEREDGVQLYQWGPTQKEGTEFYDGIGLFFTRGLTNGKSIKEVAEDKLQADKIHSEIIDPLTETTLNGIKGYSYRSLGIAEITSIILPKGKNEYLFISNGTVDPTNQGFVEIANKILSSVTIQE